MSYSPTVTGNRARANGGTATPCAGRSVSLANLSARLSPIVNSPPAIVIIRGACSWSRIIDPPSLPDIGRRHEIIIGPARCETPIDGNVLAGDVSGLVRSKKMREGGDFLR